MKTAFGFLIVMAAGVALAQPEVTNIQLTRGAMNDPIVITYHLSEPAVVLVDILTNGVSVGCDALGSMKGDAGHLVDKGNRTVTWLARKAGLPKNVEDGSVKVTAKVQAWSRYSPPDYLVVDLTQPSNFTYYATAEAIPGGVQADVNKTDRMIFRKIPAAGVTMTLGSGENEAPNSHTYMAGSNKKTSGWADANGFTITCEHKSHPMGFTNDYYMAIYECTQGQWLKIFGKDKNPWGLSGCKYTDYADSAKRPVTGRRYAGLRGTVRNTAGDFVDIANWPVDGRAVAADSEIQRFRSFTGLEYDLPTEAQWEFAARAGSTTVSPSGNAFMIDEEVNRYAWNADNWQEDPMVVGSNQTHAVGQLLPNAWGLYDTMGNSSECCLDVMNDKASSDPLDGAFSIDYPGPISLGYPNDGVGSDWRSPRRVKRGSRFLEEANMMHVTRRASMGDALGSQDATLRAWLPAESPAWQIEK